MSGRRHDNRGAAPYPRSLRVNQVLRQVLAEELERLADADERLRLVTVTSVDTAPDLRHATVYLSSLSEDAAEALAERRAQLQRALGRQVRMKRTPQLAFAVDPAVVAGSRVDEVLRTDPRGGTGRRAGRTRRSGRTGAGEPRRRRPGDRAGGGGQGGRLDLPRRGGPVPADLRPAPGGPRRHPRPRRHRRAAGRPGPGHPADAVPHRPAQDLPGRGGPRARPPPPSTPPARSPGPGTWTRWRWPRCGRRPGR